MKTIKSIKTVDGEYQIDYNGLANLPESSDTPEGFLPHGTIIKVELDGSGDFTTVEEAVASLVGKWSNGIITIQLGEGTFETSKEIVISGTSFNFSKLEIAGAGMNKTTVCCNTLETSGGVLYAAFTSCPLTVRDLTLVATQSGSIRCLRVYQSFVILKNIKLDTGVQNLVVSGCSDVVLDSNVSFSNSSSQAAACYGGSRLSTSYGAQLNFSNCKNGIAVTHGGIVALYNAKYSESNVTTLTSQAIGSATANGWITGSWTRV